MAITFLIPSYLRSCTEGRSAVGVSPPAPTLAAALDALWAAYPALRDRVLNEQAQVREYVNIFIGEQNMRDGGGFAAPVSDGCEITIVPNIAGG
jgi:molybdopterin converting factor small subunit